LISVGLDIGSRTIKMLAFENGIRDYRIIETGVNPLKRCAELLNGTKYERLVATGYGRHLVAPSVNGQVMSEIKAYAVGAHHLYPGCRTIIDIGGQDCKAIQLSENGEVQKFEMNDRCSAGTGKFLEIMAKTLEVEIGGLGNLALNASGTVQINSLCTVFAESEVVSLIARGEEPGAIVLALHQAVVTRVSTLARRTGIKETVIFAGGAAKNVCLRKLLAEKLGIELIVPENPQIVGALGAAISGNSNYSSNTGQSDLVL
jgi:(R)-2-hydroxyacyl-CoA dehydratese activating ATPase